MITTIKEFLQLIKEGLVRTHSVITHKDSIIDHLNTYGIESKLNIIDKYKFTLELENINKTDLDWTNSTIINMFGYFPSKYLVELFNKMTRIFNGKDFKWNDNIKKLTITYEAKYDDGIYSNDIICPDILYHLTPMKQLKSIQYSGLFPSNGSRETEHSSRIYLFTNLTDKDNLLKQLKLSDRRKYDTLKTRAILQQDEKELAHLLKFEDKYINQYALLKINSNGELMLHKDPNFKDKGYYTYDNISSQIIETLETDL